MSEVLPSDKRKKINQLFKKDIPINILLSFLKENFEEKETHFIINKFLYKKTEYNNNISLFISTIKEYYYSSKRKYIQREMNYNYFLTIIRQLCNANGINYTTKLVYDKSSYEIEYSIFKVLTSDVLTSEPAKSEPAKSEPAKSEPAKS